MEVERLGKATNLGGKVRQLLFTHKLEVTMGHPNEMSNVQPDILGSN